MAHKHSLLTGLMYQFQSKKPEKICNCSKINKKGLLFSSSPLLKIVTN